MIYICREVSFFKKRIMTFIILTALIFNMLPVFSFALSSDFAGGITGDNNLGVIQNCLKTLKKMHGIKNT